MYPCLWNSSSKSRNSRTLKFFQDSILRLPNPVCVCAHSCVCVCPSQYSSVFHSDTCPPQVPGWAVWVSQVVGEVKASSASALCSLFLPGSELRDSLYFGSSKLTPHTVLVPPCYVRWLSLLFFGAKKNMLCPNYKSETLVGRRVWQTGNPVWNLPLSIRIVLLFFFVCFLVYIETLFKCFY